MKDNSLLKYKTLYFLVFGGLGVLYPYLPVYFKSLQMNKSDIGILCMMPNFTSFVVAPLFSIFGDIFHAHYELMIISLVTSTIATMAILPMSSFVGLALIVLLGSVLRAPLTPQVDALVMSSLSNKSRYGELRLWGSVSYGLFSFLGGIMTSGSRTGVGEEGHDVSDQMKPRDFRFIFYAHCFCFFISGFLLLYLANKQHLDDMLQVIRDSEGRAYERVHHIEQHEDKEKVEQKPVLEALHQVFRDHPEVGVYSIAVFFTGFGSGVIDAFLFLRLQQLGGSGYVMGISRLVTSAAEVPMFQISGFLQARYGVWPVITVTQFAFVIRFAYYAFLTDPWYVLPCEVLHGFTFAVMWSVSCNYANQISPPECHSSMQALLEGLHWGFGSGMGALIGGFAYDSWGAVRLFKFSGYLALLSFFLCLYQSYLQIQASKRASQNYAIVREPIDLPEPKAEETRTSTQDEQLQSIHSPN